MDLQAKALRRIPLIVTEDEIEPRLQFDRLLPILAEGFRGYFHGRVQAAPITNIDCPEVNGEMHIKPGFLVGGAHICVKIATCYYDNPGKGLPTRDGVLVLADRENGKIEAILCDAGLITDARTAGSSAVAVDALARPGPITLGLVGAGTQAYWHARALSHVREIERILIWGRRSERVAAACQRIAEATDLPISAADLSDVSQCDVIVTTTPAHAPVLTDEILRPGALVVAMGADAAGKRELGRDILQQASLVVADSLAQCRAVGELQWLPAESLYPRVTELGAVLAGAHPGREARDEIIVFDSTGVAFQDVVSATHVLRELEESHG